MKFTKIGEMMMKSKYRTFKFLVGVAVLFTWHSVVSATDIVDMIPILFTAKTTTCTAPDEVISEDNRCWKDRNLGASQVATSSTDTNAYGDLYQWGRLADGHQIRTSGITNVNSGNDDPNHSDFITEDQYPYDWRDPQNSNLWQGIGGINNPCPQGFRIPTIAEWESERASWSSNDAAGAFASPLKLVQAGFRFAGDGSLHRVDSAGYYWSSTISTIDSIRSHGFKVDSDGAGATTHGNHRAQGFSVRCIKD